MSQYVVVSMKPRNDIEWPEITGPFDSERTALDYLQRIGLQDFTQYVCIVCEPKEVSDAA